jgi:cation:H+ antiporter
MFVEQSLPVLVGVFLAAAAGIWLAGIYLSKATDILCVRWRIGEALGGMVLLAVVTNLPEVAITASGAYRQDLSIAVGNILGGIAVQTVVLVILDVISLNKKVPLSRRAASPPIILEGVLVVAVLAVAIMGTQLPESLIFARVTPAGALIVLLWIGGLWIIGRMGRQAFARQEKASVGDKKHWGRQQKRAARPAGADATRSWSPVLVFTIGAAVTLVCGVLLEASGEEMAQQLGMNGVMFGATVLAVATALPQISTGLEAVKLGDYQMAVSDVLGGNAFLPVLIPMASLISGQAVLPDAEKIDVYLSSVGILLTAIYLAGLVARPARQIAHMGIDSFVVLLLYLASMASLLAIPAG